MHPQIRQPQPGNSPICGMPLEPQIPELEEQENPELADFRHRFWWTLPFTVIVTLLAMAAHRFFHGGLPYQNWIELALSTPVVLWAGAPFFRSGVQSIRNRSPKKKTKNKTNKTTTNKNKKTTTQTPQWFPSAFRENGRVG